MTFYSSLILITELMMLAMIIHVAGYSGFTKSQKNWYLLTFFSILVCAGAEYAVHCGFYSPEFKVPLTVITVVQFSLAPLLAVMFIGALGLRNQFRIALVTLGVNVLVEAICAPFGLVFCFTNDGYARGEYFIIYEAFYVFSLIYLIVGMLLVGKRFRHRDPFTIVMVLIIGIFVIATGRKGLCAFWLGCNEISLQWRKERKTANEIVTGTTEEPDKGKDEK